MKNKSKQVKIDDKKKKSTHSEIVKQDVNSASIAGIRII